ncbi:MAG: hypothetical protein WA798_18840 [Candidatus Acidiferrum sp.]
MRTSAVTEVSKRRYFMMDGVGVGLLLFGLVGALFTHDIDFSREYGQLVRKYLDLVSFNGELSELRGHRFSGKIILCNEHGARYSDLGSTLPDSLLSSHSTDVQDIVFIRREDFIEGRYTDGTPATAVALKVCVVDVPSAKVVAIVHFTGHSPGVIIKMSGEAPTGLASANRQLFNWIVGGELPSGQR